MTNTYKLHLMYDGTQFSGWQIQPHSLSIQQIVQEAVCTLTKEAVHVIGSGRTDAGVHALDQVAHFRCTHPMRLDSFMRSMNGILPKEIRLTKVEEAPNTFHAQRSAIGKEYHYQLRTGPFVSPFERFFVWHVPYKLDLALLKEATQFFIGTHDFSSFANSAHMGACAKNPIRTLSKLDLVEREQGFSLQFVANGFLYKMVRNIVGMLIEVASNKKPLRDIATIMQAKDRRLAGHAAPPSGLFLAKVFYESVSS